MILAIRRQYIGGPAMSRSLITRNGLQIETVVVLRSKASSASRCVENLGRPDGVFGARCNNL